MRILAIDIGGTNVKVAMRDREKVRIPSGSTMSPKKMVAEVLEATKDWNFDAVSIGYPGPVVNGGPASDPHNLASGWVDYNFEQGFGKPVRLTNDAAMQALGSYEGGRMLFLGLGTGLGSALVVENVLIPTELAHLPFKKGKTFEDFVGVKALEKLGKKKWQAHVFGVVATLQAALLPDYIVLGGGNVKKLAELPPLCRRGDNANAFLGGYRLWEGTGADAHSHAANS
jgi:polyphosphate glucokinase